MGIAWADPVAALVVLLVITRVAWRILASNIGVLVDRVAVAPDRVKAAIGAIAGVRGCHRIRSRGTQVAYTSTKV